MARNRNRWLEATLVFDFTLNPGRDGPRYFLRDYQQVLLADRYADMTGCDRQSDDARWVLRLMPGGS